MIHETAKRIGNFLASNNGYGRVERSFNSAVFISTGIRTPGCLCIGIYEYIFVTAAPLYRRMDDVITFIVYDIHANETLVKTAVKIPPMAST